jgi:NAD(P)-dependent dehydrogenase (short-subunit alcohol dehydrogenase family)
MAGPAQGVVITGAAGDLGRALVTGFLADGWTVFGADLAPQPAAAGLVAVPLDVTDRAGVFALAARAERESRLGAWINAAGVFATGPVATAEEADWHRLIAVNLTGTFNGCAAAVPALARGGGGRIVNVGSISGQVGGVGVHPAYGASKAGVHALTKTYALEGARHGVLCNAVAPGLLEGRMGETFPPDRRARLAQANPLRRLGRIAEVAQVIRFLVDPASSYLNGAILPVNGGAYMPG